MDNKDYFRGLTIIQNTIRKALAMMTYPEIHAAIGAHAAETREQRADYATHIIRNMKANWPNYTREENEDLFVKCFTVLLDCTEVEAEQTFNKWYALKTEVDQPVLP